MLYLFSGLTRMSCFFTECILGELRGRAMLCIHITCCRITVETLSVKQMLNKSQRSLVQGSRNTGLPCLLPRAPEPRNMGVPGSKSS